jgi:thioredoxin reductase
VTSPWVVVTASEDLRTTKSFTIATGVGSRNPTLRRLLRSG